MKSNYDSYNMGLILCFEDVFLNEKIEAPAEYLEDINTNSLIEASAFLLTYNVNREKLDNPELFLNTFFSPGNQNLKENILEIIREMQRKSKKNVGIFIEYSGLRLIEIALGARKNENNLKNEEFERNIFKGLLALNTEFTNKQLQALESTREITGFIKIPLMLFTMHYPVADKTNYKLDRIWMAQVIKAILLFEFLESNSTTKPLLEEFCKYFEVEDWKEYIKSLLPITQNIINRVKEGNTDLVVPNGESFEKNTRFLDKLIATHYDPSNENDFLTLRSKPILRTKKGTYRILFDLFATELIFKGLYFKLREINETLEKYKIPNLKGIYGLEFSEKILLYKSLKSIYPDCIQYTGDQIDQMRIDSAPDFYLRKKNMIMLFESKDFLIRADKKFSFDYGTYDQEFGKTLDFEEKGGGKIKAGAVMQLVKNITRALKKDFSFDKGYNLKEVKIYPVIVLHDLQYEVLGFNTFVEQWFNEEIRILKEEGYNINRIMTLTIVNIDSLLLYQKVLEKRRPLHEFINDFHRTRSNQYESENDLYRNFRSFGLFLEEQIRLKGINRKPDIISKVVDQLFSTSDS